VGERQADGFLAPCGPEAGGITETNGGFELVDRKASYVKGGEFCVLWQVRTSLVGTSKLNLILYGDNVGGHQIDDKAALPIQFLEEIQQVHFGPAQRRICEAVSYH
jgi:hypothetical protein